MKEEHYPFDNYSLGKFSMLRQKRAMSHYPTDIYQLKD